MNNTRLWISHIYSEEKFAGFMFTNRMFLHEYKRLYVLYFQKKIQIIWLKNNENIQIF